MLETIAQAKGYIRASNDKLFALTEVALETDSEYVFRFTESYRWLLNIAQTKRANNVPCGKKPQDAGKIQNKERINEMDNAQNGLNKV